MRCSRPPLRLQRANRRDLFSLIPVAAAALALAVRGESADQWMAKHAVPGDWQEVSPQVRQHAPHSPARLTSPVLQVFDFGTVYNARSYPATRYLHTGLAGTCLRAAPLHQ